jgi:trehalose 6-phosphate phosphatase
VDPRQWLLAFDFDGTLSEIVPRPAEAVLDPALLPFLNRLHGAVGHLAVISGRDRAALASRLPPSWLALGSYGLELPTDISASGYPPGFEPLVAARALQRAARELAALAQDWPGTRLEEKTWGRALHFRGGGEPAFHRPETLAAVADVAARHGLGASRGRLVIEVRPRGADKGWAISHLAQRLEPSAIVFAGDDLGDVPAWEALQPLSGTMPTLAVGVASGEVDRASMAACDLVLDGRPALAGFLRGLVELARA